MWELDHKEGWAPKNWCLQIVVLEKTLESPLDCKEIKQVNPKRISPEYSLEGLMLKLKLQYFVHLMWRTDSFEKILMLEKIEGRMTGGERGWDGWMASPTQWTWVWVGSGSWWWTGKPGVLQSMGSQSQTRLSNWTELNSLAIATSSVVALKCCSARWFYWAHQVSEEHIFHFSILFTGSLADANVDFSQ